MTYPELDAWVAHEMPDGVRNPKVVVSTYGVATGSAVVDFAKVRRAQGSPPGWLMEKLLDEEIYPCAGLDAFLAPTAI